MKTWLAPIVVMLLVGDARADDASPLGSDVQGTLVYARDGRIKKLTLGEKKPVDLGEGDCARFSADGKWLAVYHDRRVFVMDAGGKNRRQLLEGADAPEDGCAVEFHSNGREILYVKRNDGLWSVGVRDGKTRKLELPGRYTGEISVSADGKRLTARWGHDLYAVDLIARTHRKFAKGCSPGVSPDGKLVINNTGGHHEMVVRPWEEGDSYKISGREARPDGSWDDFHWSNHPDFIVAAGDRRAEESYVVRVSDRRVFRATWEGGTRFPDLFVARVAATAARTPAHAAPPSADGIPVSPDERARLQRLAQTVEGAVVYTHRDRIHKVTLGDPRPADLGSGECARFSPDGKRVAIVDRGRLYLANADGSARTELVSDVGRGDGCTIDFHGDGEEIVFVRKKAGVFSVRIGDRSVRKLAAPGAYTGQPGSSADGKRLVARWGEDLYAIDLERGTHRKFAKGCSPALSPDGKWLLRNVGGHHRARIESWDGAAGFELDAASCLPDQRWNALHWSNHPNYIVAKGEERGDNIYVVDVAANQGTRVTWERGDAPDLFVSRARGVARGSGPAPGAPKAVKLGDTWPGSTDGLVWLWEDATRPNEVGSRACRVVARDAARFSRHHGMDLAGGGFVAEDAGGPVLEAIRRGDAFTFEAIVTAPAEGRERKGSRIVALGDHFVLRDSREDLRVFVRTAETEGKGGEEERETVLGALPSGTPTHVVISYRPGLLVYHANGREVFRTGLVKGTLRGWSDGQLVFGAGPRDARPWRGSVDAVALYARFVDGGEASQKFALLGPRLDQRKTVQRHTFRGRVLEVSAIPDPKSLEPYRRALVTTVYEVLDGDAPGGHRKVQVAAWAILDGRVVRRAARIRVGDERAVTVEPFDAHPQLESERLLSDAQDPGVPLYYDPAAVDRNDLVTWGAEETQARRAD